MQRRPEHDPRSVRLFSRMNAEISFCNDILYDVGYWQGGAWAALKSRLAQKIHRVRLSESRRFRGHWLGHFLGGDLEFHCFERAKASRADTEACTRRSDGGNAAN